MNLPNHISRVAAATTDLDDHLGSGVSRRSIAARVRSGQWKRVGRRGVVTSQTMQSWFPHERHLATVLAAHRDARSPPVFSHFSAAAILGLPMWKLRDIRAHTVSTSSHTQGRTVVRHEFPIGAGDVIEVAGLRCTGPDRTLFDLSAIAHEDLVLGCADARLRALANFDRRIDLSASDDWRDRMRARADAAPGSRGVKLFRRAIALADARAESVLESVSRLRFTQLGIEVEPQFAVPSPTGGHYFVDFRLIGHSVLGECDARKNTWILNCAAIDHPAR